MTLRKTRKELLDSISAFAANGVPTMQEALEIWDQQNVIAKTKRRVRQDALCLCKKLEIAPNKLIAHIANLNPRIRRLTGISKKRRSNLKNSIKILLMCLPHQGRSFKAELTPPWAAMEAVVPDEYRLASVHCMMRYGSAQNILPEHFDDDVSASLLAALVNERLNGDPIVTHQNAVRASNWLGFNAPGWRIPHLTPPRYANQYIEPWANLPPWCEVITGAFIDRGTTADPFDLSRPMNAWRPATIKTYEILLRRFFSMAKQVHDDLGRPRAWREVATFTFAERVLKWGIARNGGKRGQVMAANIAVLLAQIAENPEAKAKLTPEEKIGNEAVAAELLQLAGRLHKSKGLSAKVRARVSQFKDESNLAKLFLLPFALEREVTRGRMKRRTLALQAQWTVALMLLTFCPLRIFTIARIADRHLKWSQPKRRGELTLELEGDMLKAGEPASIPLPRECARVIKLYSEKHRSALFKCDTDLLFPSEKTGASKNAHNLATQLQKLIRSRTGMEVNSHLYRHLVHIVILRRFPGAHAMISRVLLHRSLETAVKNYAHFDAELSMKAYQKLIKEVQAGTRSENMPSTFEVVYNQTEYDNASRKSPR